MRNRGYFILACLALPGVAQAEDIQETPAAAVPSAAVLPAGVQGPRDVMPASFTSFDLATAGSASAASAADEADDQDATGSSTYPQSSGSDEPEHKFSLFLTAGTLGLGPELRYRFAKRWGVRGSVTYIGFGLDSEVDGIKYAGDVRLGSGGIAVDYFFGDTSTWHVSAGLRYDSNDYRVQFQPHGPIQIGDKVYTPEQVGRITGRIEGAWQLAPTLTVGKTWGGEQGFQFGFEAGAMFHKALQVKELQADGALARLEEFLRNLAKHRAGIDNDLDVLNVFPIFQILVGYKF